jgi:hypothetical protein
MTAPIRSRDQLIAEKEQEKAGSIDDVRKPALKTFIPTLKKAHEGMETYLVTKTSELEI